MTSVWSLARAHGRLWAGTGPAALFTSDDDGDSFTHVAGLQAHPSRPDWHGGGAGLILHSLVPDPADPARLWIGMSSVGVFETRDGGASWTPRNRGIRADYLPEGEENREFGQCVHNFARAPGPGDRLYQQNHCGMYRSDDGGQAWVSIEPGLPSDFGFPVAVHPRDPDTVFLIPLNDQSSRYVPEARAAVWRSRDGGQNWTDCRAGLPQEHAYLTVLRQAMATDAGHPAGVYFGTSSGTLYASRDEGENWQVLARDLPQILSVETLQPG